MHRGIHIAVTVLAVFLLIKPFDCATGGKYTKAAADCCKGGKCRPSTDDDCCKGTLPDGKNVIAAAKAQLNHAPIVLPSTGTSLPSELMVSGTSLYLTNVPPGSPPSSRLTLP